MRCRQRRMLCQGRAAAKFPPAMPVSEDVDRHQMENTGIW